MGQDIRAWPMLALLLLVVLVAIGCVLWFMREAMRNERLAVRQTLAEAYRGQLALVCKHVEEEWQRGLEKLDQAEPGGALFARAVLEGWADSLVFPGFTQPPRDASANAALLAIEAAPQDRALIEKLRDRLNDYEVPMPSAQRRFLMRELQRFAPELPFPTLAAEDLAARYLDANPTPPEALSVSGLPGVWHAASPARKAIVLFETPNLRSRFNTAWPASVQSAILAPGEDSDAALVVAPLGAPFPGWRVALSLDDRTLLDATGQRVATHLWIGSAFIAAMTVLAIFIARGFGRQMQLARLKNDLVATVSHELKTPLTAMRALVDTLLDTEQFDEKTTREYLQLLARENARLSRLIDNFLTFSRLERGKFTFEFKRLSSQDVVEEALAATGERRIAIESVAAADLPDITGDHGALVTVLLNLLDNAWKYSGGEKQITLRTEAHHGSVRFAVEDRGIGLTLAESRRVFDRFYQADQRLARTAGGCGLGLSIVQSIVVAHGGTVQVASEPGRGSTFTIEIPAAS
jgi:signal transduction histidine kinase